jgi:hypothetical protein
MSPKDFAPAPKFREGMFSRQEIARLVEDTVPPDRTNAVVGTVDRNGLAVVLKMTKGEHWTIEAAFTRDWAGDTKAGAAVIYSW